MILLKEKSLVGAREGGRKRERERERPTQAGFVLGAEPDAGLYLTNHEIMTRATIKSRTLSQLSHPDAPISLISVEGDRFYSPVVRNE